MSRGLDKFAARAWPPSNIGEYVRGEEFALLLLDVAKQVGDYYDLRTEAAAAVASVFIWFDQESANDAHFLDRFTEKHRFRRYLWRAIYHEGLKESRRRASGLPFDDEAEVPSRLALPPDRQAASNEFGDAAERAMSALPTHTMQEVLRLRLFAGMRNKDVAKLLKLSPCRTSRLYSEGITRLADALEPFAPEEGPRR